MTGPRKMECQIAQLANSLTSEQAIRLYQIAAPLTAEESAAFDAMSDEELLQALGAPNAETDEPCSQHRDNGRGICCDCGIAL